MDGQAFLSGLRGFGDGWRFGREMVEGDAEDRRARAATLSAQQEAMAKSMDSKRKAEMDAWKERNKDDRARAQRELTARRYTQLGEQSDRDYALNKERYGLEEQRYTDAAPTREQQLRRLKYDNARAEAEQTKRVADDEYVQGAQAELKDFQSYWDGKLDEGKATRWDSVMGIAATDPRPAREALQDLLPKSAALMQQGQLDAVAQLWASPQGKTAMAAWEPAYKASVGSTVEGGNYVIQDVNPNRLEMNPDGRGAAMILDVSIAPSNAFRTQLEAQMAKATTPEERARIERQLAPSTYQAPLTQGRVAVAEGGQPRIFTADEFAQGLSSLDKRVAFHQQNPEAVEKLRRRLLARASGKDMTSGLAAEAKLEGDFMQEAAKQEDQRIARGNLDVRERGLNLKRVGTGAGNGSVKAKLEAIERATRIPKIKDKETDEWFYDPELVEHRNAVTAKATDLILQDNAISVEDALRQADAAVPMPKSAVDQKLASLMERTPPAAPAEQGLSPTGNIDGMRIRNPKTGQEMVLRNGAWMPVR